MSPPGPTVAILIPVFNDWDAAERLLELLDQQLEGCSARVLLVDDGSTAELPGSPKIAFRNIRVVDVLHLRRNLGHQRAIAIGLFEIHERIRCQVVVVMDGDGEDRPEDVPRLLAEFHRQGGRRVVFAARTKRLEKFTFQFCYRMYRVLHWMLTGVAVRVGNFSVIPQTALTRLMAVSDLWNHYAAAVFRSRIPYSTLPLPRGRRLAGESRMNFIALLIHGISAISVFGDVVAARILAFTAFLLVVSAALSVLAVSLRLAAGMGLPNWAGTILALAVVAFLQALMLAGQLVFVIVGGRSNMGFLPARDAHFFILDRTVWFDASVAGTAPGVAAIQPAGDPMDAAKGPAEKAVPQAGGGDFAVNPFALETFAKARRWKQYWKSQIASYVRGDVLEVGAGLGANTRLLADLPFQSWTCLEPQTLFRARLEACADCRHRIVTGGIADLAPDQKFDCILYLDVLEHVPDDREELERAAGLLRSGGALVLLAPACPWLYSEFDRAIGHFRRYTIGSLRAAVPPQLCERRVGYMDSAGILASLSNRLLLHSAQPPECLVLAWDRLLVPLSRMLDTAFRGRVGKSILGIWTAP